MTNGGNFKMFAQGEREIVITRTFNAPRELVYEAMVTPALVQRWLLGPPGWTMPLCEIDLRVGGKYRYVWRNEKGTEMAMGGVFREIVPHQRLVMTEKFDDPWYPGEGVNTTTLVEKDGVTTFTCTMLAISREARDGILKSGMEKGVIASYDRLAEVLATMGR